jgi:hypothetical protein
MVTVVQEQKLWAELVPDRLEDGRDVPQVGAGAPVFFGRANSRTRRLVVVALRTRRSGGSDTMDLAESGDR